MVSDQLQSHILKKYEVIEKMGKGAYGIVWKAIDRKQKIIVALKKAFDAFQNAVDAQRTFRQVSFLQQIDHPNIVRLMNLFRAQNNKDLYMVFEFMESDLHIVVRSGILTEDHRKYIIYQIVKALKYLHSALIIHRDLKPSNILIDSSCTVKLADFGLARSVLSKEDSKSIVMTQYVATRWYRAPEILFGSNSYGMAVDMWSVGCIFGEMLNGKAIFPGNSNINQIQKIIELTGKPTAKDLDQLNSQNLVRIMNCLPDSKKRSFGSFFPSASEDALDFVKSLLKLNPKQRLTAQQALKHKYLAQLHDPKKEIQREQPIQIGLDDNTRFEVKEYRQNVYADILRRKKQMRQVWKTKYLQRLGVQPIKSETESKHTVKSREQPKKIESARQVRPSTVFKANPKNVVNRLIEQSISVHEDKQQINGISSSVLVKPSDKGWQDNKSAIGKRLASQLQSQIEIIRSNQKKMKTYRVQSVDQKRKTRFQPR